MKIIKIAWRNIWRNTSRSLVVILSVAIGLWSGLFISSVYSGMIEQRIDKMINSDIMHAQIHHPKFKDDQEMKYFIKDGQEIIDELKKDSSVKAVSGRIISNGIIQSSYITDLRGIVINGVNPQEEIDIRDFNERIVEGNFFESESNLVRIVIGTHLAEKLKLKINNKPVIQFTNSDGELKPFKCKVVGIYSTKNKFYDETNVFVDREALLPYVGNNVAYNEIAIKYNNFDATSEYVNTLNKKYPKLLSETWKELQPSIEFFLSTLNNMLVIIMAIIFLAMTFGIVNTMLMAVLERTKEIGVLMAIGLNRKKVFSMIMLETIFISGIGGLIGIVSSILIIGYLNINGLNLGIWSEETLEMAGYDAIVYPSITNNMYLNIGVSIILLAIVAAIYPATRALKLNPTEAIRKI